MLNVNIIFAINLVLTIIALMASGRVLHLSRNRDEYLRKHKYKPGSLEYKRIEQLSSPEARKIVLIATPLLVLGLVLIVFDVAQTSGHDGLVSLAYITGFICSIAAVGAWVLFSVFKRI